MVWESNSGFGGALGKEEMASVLTTHSETASSSKFSGLRADTSIDRERGASATTARSRIAPVPDGRLKESKWRSLQVPEPKGKGRKGKGRI